MKRLEHCLLTILIICLFVAGFDFMYMHIWVLLGLPIEWWSSLITVALGGLSTWGLLAWIERVTEDV